KWHRGPVPDADHFGSSPGSGPGLKLASLYSGPGCHMTQKSGPEMQQKSASFCGKNPVQDLEQRQDLTFCSRTWEPGPGFSLDMTPKLTPFSRVNSKRG